MPVGVHVVSADIYVCYKLHTHAYQVTQLVPSNAK